MTEPPIYPLLMLPEPTPGNRESLRPGWSKGSFRRPTPEEQGDRLSTRFQALDTAMQQRRTTLTTTLEGVDPELVLVFEIATTIDDFSRAVARIPGFEFLAELDEDAIEDAEHAFGPQDNNAPVPGTLFLMATNQEALAAVLDMWNGFVRGDNSVFPRNFGRWRQVFAHLLDVRRWSAQDRLRGTGAVRDFAARVAAGQETIPAELELWYRTNGDRRAAAEAAVSAAIEQGGGRVLASADVGEISYHAILAALPISQVNAILQGAPQDVALLRVEDLAFVRPQSLVVAPVDLAGEDLPASPGASPAAPVEGAPLVGVLDGVPMLGHQDLRDRIILDDPDDLASDAQAHQRQHGTAVASIVAHGDLGGTRESLQRPIYHRPVLVPDVLFNGNVVERIPSNTLAIDLLFRAVRRMYEGDAGSAPTAPSVRVINVALGDATNPLATTISPWARLMDWLAHRYGVLFVISAGNHGGVIQYDQARRSLQNLTDRALRIETFDALVGVAHQRRLLSPAESLNALTVGASHDDATVSAPMGSRIDLFRGSGTGIEAAPSVMSAIGMGYRQSIKPDVLAPGGRLLFNNAGTDTAVPALFHMQPTPSRVAPGVRAAAPASSGRTDATWFVHGTSFSAAHATHMLGLLVEQLEGLQTAAGDDIPPEEVSVLAKALAVHSAHIPQCADELREVLSPTVGAQKMRNAVSRFYGYGILNPERMRSGALTRVTLLGTGRLNPEQGHRYGIPLPPSLAGQVIDRHLTITVASFVPTRARDHRHRMSDVYFVPDTATLKVSRAESDQWAVRHGAVQHEVLSGNRAAAFVDGDELGITVSCRSLVGAHREASLYGLAVTLEVPEDVALPIYAEVSARVRTLIEARSRARARGR